ncbi:MAG: hypothetical protein AB7L65_04265 [Hyphomonadaceae bacterium]
MEAVALRKTDQRQADPVRFIDPRGALEAPVETYDLRLEGETAAIALICNGFPGADRLLDGLKAALMRLEPGWTFRAYLKPITSSESPPALLDQVASECDVAIGAYGHCGSCTAGTVRDGVLLARRRMPSIALVTAHFTECGEI